MGEVHGSYVHYNWLLAAVDYQIMLCCMSYILIYISRKRLHRSVLDSISMNLSYNINIPLDLSPWHKSILIDLTVKLSRAH